MFSRFISILATCYLRCSCEYCMLYFTCKWVLIDYASLVMLWHISDTRHSITQRSILLSIIGHGLLKSYLECAIYKNKNLISQINCIEITFKNLSARISLLANNILTITKIFIQNFGKRLHNLYMFKMDER